MKRKKLRFLTFFYVAIILAIAFDSKAQNRVYGKVNNLYSVPITKATVFLFLKERKDPIQTVITDSLGQFLFKNLIKGGYLIKANFIGYQSAESGSFEVIKNDVNVGVLFLSPIDLQLNEVVVEGKRKPIEQQDGKMVINLQNSATTGGSSALDVLERLPNITVDKQSNQISLIGKQGSIIMIDGKRTYMPNAALLQFLSGINASKINKVEIIANPSAALDAEGNAGIVNIVMNKNYEEGVISIFEGQAGYGQGGIGNFNGDLNYVKNKINISLSYGFFRQSQAQTSYNTRKSEYNNDFYVSTISNRDPIQRNHNFRMGLDYQLNDNTTISTLITAFDNKWSMNAVNYTMIDAIGQSYSKSSVSINELNYWKHLGGAFSLQQKLANNKLLSVNIDYLHYQNNNPTSYYTSSFDLVGAPVDPVSARSNKASPINIIVPQLNYTVHSTDKMVVRVGAKASLSRFDNLTSVDRLINGYWNEDPALTSQARMREIITGSFAEIDYKILDKLSMKGGIRYEYTMFDLSGNFPSNNLNKNYGNWFPSISMTREFNEHNLLSVSYAKRINRPAFGDIAPFVLFLDPYTLFTGNPAIQPSYTHNISANYTFYNFLFSASYSNENNSITKFQVSINPANNTQLFRPENLSATRIINIGVTAPIQLTKWWTLQGSVNGSTNKINTGAFQNNRTLTQYSAQISGSQQFKILKKNTIELSAFYNTTALEGTSVIQPYGGVVFGIQRKMQNSLIRFNINDVLNSIKHTAIINTGEYIVYNGFDFSQPTYKLSYSYTFGNLKSNNNIKSRSAEEERKRAQ